MGLVSKVYQRRRQLTGVEVAKIEARNLELRTKAYGKRVRLTVLSDVTYVGTEYVYLDGKPLHILDIEAVEVVRDSEWHLHDDGKSGHYDRFKGY